MASPKSVTPSSAGTRSRTRCVSRRAVRSSASRVAISERSGGAQSDDRGHVLEPGAPGPLLVAAEQQRPQPQPTPHEQRADARRTAELVGADRQQVGAEVVEVDGHVAGRLGGVDVHEHVAFAAALRRPRRRLQRADLVVAPLQVDERGVGPDGVGDRVADRRGRRRSTSDPRHLGVGGRGQAHRGVLDRGQRPCATPRGAAPHVAAAIASVAPLVNTTSRCEPRAARRPASRASSTATRAVVPLGVDAAGSPTRAVTAATATIASMASGRSGEVDAWSR